MIHRLSIFPFHLQIFHLRTMLYRVSLSIIWVFQKRNQRSWQPPPFCQDEYSYVACSRGTTDILERVFWEFDANNPKALLVVYIFPGKSWFLDIKNQREILSSDLSELGLAEIEKSACIKMENIIVVRSTCVLSNLALFAFFKNKYKLVNICAL